jgi:hypothetical protein
VPDVTETVPSGGSGGGNPGGNPGGGNPGGGPTGGGGGNAGGGGGHHRRGDKKDGHRRRRHHRYRHDGTRLYETADQNAPVQSVNLQAECDRGYEDGLKTGAKDALRGQSNDPQRSGNYKSGGGGFFSWGRSDAAKRAYRDCFLRGYEEGYRNPHTNPVGANP